MYTKVCIICPEHGEFWQAPFFHLNGNGCKMCSLKQNVKENNLYRKICERYDNVTYQKRIDFLGRQSLDIFLDDYNIAIEYQGEQHFEPVELFGGEKQFLIQKERDERKFSLCKENNIKLLYFIPRKYKDIIDGIYKNNSYYNYESLFNRIEKEAKKARRNNN